MSETSPNDTPVGKHTDAVVAGRNPEKRPLLAIFRSNPKELARDSKAFFEKGYDILPVVVTSTELKNLHGDDQGKIIKGQLENDSSYIGPYSALLGNPIVSSPADVMAVMGKFKPDCALIANTFGFGAEWAKNSEVLHAVQKISSLPVVMDAGIKISNVNPALQAQERQNHYRFASWDEVNAIDRIFREGMKAQSIAK